jgi:hypothetical protein
LALLLPHPYLLLGPRPPRLPRRMPLLLPLLLSLPPHLQVMPTLMALLLRLPSVLSFPSLAPSFTLLVPAFLLSAATSALLSAMSPVRCVLHRRLPSVSARLATAPLLVS